MTTMIHDKLDTVRFFFRHLRNAGLPLTGKCTLLIAGAALLSSVSSGQVPTVTVLTYVTEYETFHVVPNVITVPAAAQMSGFASLLGGGLGSVLSDAIAPTSMAAATAGVRALAIAQKARIEAQVKERIYQDAQAKKQETVENNPEVTQCAAGPESIPLRKRAHSAAGGCMLPEEETAEEAQENLESVTESGEATQEAVEAAEELAEGAEAAAEAAEIAVEGALDAIEVLEVILDLAALGG